MPIISKTGLSFLQLVVFFVIIVISVIAFPYLTAETYRPGETPSSFRVIAVRQGGPGSQATQYQLVGLSEIKETRRRDPQITFKLPQPEGSFNLPRPDYYPPDRLLRPTRFRVLEATSNGQLVEVVWHTEHYEHYERYFTDGISLRPIYLRVWGPNSIFFGGPTLGFIPALIGAWFVGWLVRRKWLKGSSLEKPTNG